VVGAGVAGGEHGASTVLRHVRATDGAGAVGVAAVPDVRCHRDDGARRNGHGLGGPPPGLLGLGPGGAAAPVPLDVGG